MIPKYQKAHYLRSYSIENKATDIKIDMKGPMIFGKLIIV